MKRVLIMAIIFIIAFPVMAKSWLGTKAPDEQKEVGDIVFNDGSAIPYTEDLTLTKAQTEAAIAIIFYKGRGLSNSDRRQNVTLGVGLKHDKSGLTWCRMASDSDCANANSMEITPIKCYFTPIDSGKEYIFREDLDGSDNLEQIGVFLKNNGSSDDTAIAKNYPAFYYAKNYKDSAKNLGKSYKTGWYLPSLAELYYIWKNIAVVDKASNICGGDMFSEATYWSSSECSLFNAACIFSFTTEYMCNTHYKGFLTDGKCYYVCAIREF